MPDLFVTGDRRIIQPGPLGLDPDDRRAMPDGCESVTPEEALARATADGITGGPSLPQPSGARAVSREELTRLAHQADDRLAEFDEVVRVLLGPAGVGDDGPALVVRRWRVEEGMTWRAVARAADDLFPGIWGSQPSNQLAGLALCTAAARLLGEDAMGPLWNADKPP